MPSSVSLHIQHVRLSSLKHSQNYTSAYTNGAKVCEQRDFIINRQTENFPPKTYQGGLSNSVSDNAREKQLHGKTELAQEKTRFSQTFAPRCTFIRNTIRINIMTETELCRSFVSRSESTAAVFTGDDVRLQQAKNNQNSKK